VINANEMEPAWLFTIKLNVLVKTYRFFSTSDVGKPGFISCCEFFSKNMQLKTAGISLGFAECRYKFLWNEIVICITCS